MEGRLHENLSPPMCMFTAPPSVSCQRRKYWRKKQKQDALKWQNQLHLLRVLQNKPINDGEITDVVCGRRNDWRCVWWQTRLDACFLDNRSQISPRIGLFSQSTCTSEPFFLWGGDTWTETTMGSGAGTTDLGMTRRDMTLICAQHPQMWRQHWTVKTKPAVEFCPLCLRSPGSAKNYFSRVAERGPAAMPCVMFWMVGQCADWFEMTIFIDVSVQASAPSFSFLQLHHLMDLGLHSSQPSELRTVNRHPIKHHQ